MRQSFFYGRTFLNDEDLNTQAQQWLEQTCNVRRHRTIAEAPATRFERDEREHLGTLASRPYPRLGVAQAPAASPRPLPRIEVQRRSLNAYAEAIR